MDADAIHVCQELVSGSPKFRMVKMRDDGSRHVESCFGATTVHRVVWFPPNFG